MRNNLLSMCQTLKHVELSGPQNNHKKEWHIHEKC